MAKFTIPPNQWQKSGLFNPDKPQNNKPGIVLPFKGKTTQKPKSGKELINDLYHQLENNRDEFIGLQQQTQSRIWKFKVKPDKEGNNNLLIYVDNTKTKPCQQKDAMAAISGWFTENVGETFNTIMLEVRSLAKKCCYKKCHGCNEGNPAREM